MNKDQIMELIRGIWEASQNDHTQMSWVNGSIYFDREQSEFPGIFPDRCMLCKIIFPLGGTNSICKSDSGYVCLVCEHRTYWYDFWYWLENFAEYEIEWIDDILENYNESFEDYQLFLFTSKKSWDEELEAFGL